MTDVVIGCALVVFGAVSVGAIVSSLFTDAVDDRWLLIAILTILSTIAIAVGWERAAAFEAIEQQIRKLEPRLTGIEASIAQAVGAVHVAGHETVFRHSLVPISMARKSFISIVVPGAPRAPEWWFDAVVSQLQRGNAAGERITWHVYLAGAEDGTPTGLVALAERRFKRLVEEGVADQCAVWHVPYGEQTGFDFFIVDGETTYLTLPSAAGSDLPHRVVVITSADVASHLVHWISTLDRVGLHGAARHSQQS